MEALILRRNYPAPVTFADLRRAYTIRATKRGSVCSHVDFLPHVQRIVGGFDWHAAIKIATSATDDVYAVRDGREVHVARVSHDEVFMGSHLADRIGDLLITADEAGYWERPHEVRIDLQERIPSIAAIGKVVQRSLIEAEVRRGH